MNHYMTPRFAGSLLCYPQPRLWLGKTCIIQLAVDEYATAKISDIDTILYKDPERQTFHFFTVTAYSQDFSFWANNIVLIYFRMGPKEHLLLVLVLLIFTDHGQGVPETYEQSLIVSKSTDSTVVELRATPHPINTPRWHNRSCNCKGKEREMVSTLCRCQPSARRNGKNGKWKKLCQLEKSKNLQKCHRFSKLKTKNTSKFGPSVPI
ncbi:uncharacterized protein LOC127536435 [Acanthochromis polyacanthus]|uniref:uncharacterized protein LOC127536435 n=1 Tax=Acanthochromis polyacanthus TaxID=80966 RepID=UPI0022345B6D|nr:uncharacterized protein LOC127536435 [Acanthochromis polyacanthus]